MSFAVRTATAAKLIDTLQECIFVHCAPRLKIVPFGYETHVHKEIRNLLRKGCVVFLICLVAFNLPSHANTRTARAADISVYIGDELLQLEDRPVIREGRTLVPMRGFFEALGARVAWEANTRTAAGSRGAVKVRIPIASTTPTVNGKIVRIDVPAQVIANRTYIPLRFVGEALGDEIRWDGAARRITITRKVPKIYLSVEEAVPVKPFDFPVIWSLSDNSIVEIDPDGNVRGLKPGITEAVATAPDGSFAGRYTFRVVPSEVSVFRNSYSTKDFVEISAVQGQINVNGTTLTDNNWAWLVVTNVQTNTPRNVFTVINPDKSFNLSINEHLPSGMYKIGVNLGRERYGLYSSKLWDLDLVSTGDKLYFPISMVYKDNIQQYEAKRGSLLLLTRVDAGSQYEEKTLRDLAAEITRGMTDKYDKVFAISNWVSENIYYDWDAYRSGIFGRTDAFGTLETRRSVCAGYAYLTAALVRSLGIPARVVSGVALGYSVRGQNWDAIDRSISNHAWNEAYVDGRWIKIDTTWNSNNRFENGRFTKRPPVLTYFDMTTEFLSLRHKILD